MPEPITITPAPGLWRVSAGGTVPGESRQALELREAGHDPVIYLPRGDIDMSRLHRSDRKTTCPWKGMASHYSIDTAEGVLTDAAWSYEAPKPGKEAIAGHLAFYADRVTVGKV